MEKREGERSLFIDCLKIFMCYCIVVFHVAGGRVWIIDIMSQDWMIYHLYEGMTAGAVAVFIMISGALILSKGRMYVRYIGHKLLSYLRLAIFWGIFYSIFETIRIEIRTPREFALSVYNQFVYSSAGWHLWYLYMLAGLMIVLPFSYGVCHIENEGKKPLLLLILSAFLFFGIIRPTLALFPDSNGSPWINFLFRVDTGIFAGWGFYIGYFILGYVLFHLCKRGGKRKPVWYVTALISVGVIVKLFGVLATGYLAKTQDATLMSYYDNNTVYTFICAVCIFCGAYYLVDMVSFSKKVEHLIHSLAEKTQGIYLIHWVFTRILGDPNIHIVDINPLLMVPVVAAGVFGVCIVIVSVLKHTPYIRKFL